MKHHQLFDEKAAEMGRQYAVDLYDWVGMDYSNWLDFVSSSWEVTHLYGCAEILHVAKKFGLEMDEFFDVDEMPETIDESELSILGEEVTVSRPVGDEQVTYDDFLDRLRTQLAIEGDEALGEKTEYEIRPLLENPVFELQEYPLVAIIRMCKEVDCDWLSVIKDIYRRYLANPEEFPTTCYPIKKIE